MGGGDRRIRNLDHSPLPWKFETSMGYLRLCLKKKKGEKEGRRQKEEERKRKRRQKGREERNRRGRGRKWREEEGKRWREGRREEWRCREEREERGNTSNNIVPAACMLRYSLSKVDTELRIQKENPMTSFHNIHVEHFSCLAHRK